MRSNVRIVLASLTLVVMGGVAAIRAEQAQQGVSDVEEIYVLRSLRCV